MHTSNETLRGLERLHVRAWPASETARLIRETNFQFSGLAEASQA